MKAAFYRYLLRASRLLGPGFFLLVARGIATGYFLFGGTRRSISRDFYAALFPGKGRVYHYYAAWRQFIDFTRVFLDRFVQREVRDFAYTITGREHVVDLACRKRGGILLISHMGNWEVAAHLLTRVHPDLRVLLYMGIRDKEQIEQIQKHNLRQDGLRVVGMAQSGGSPFAIVEGMRFLQTGGFVAMAGDRVWHDGQRTLGGTFLGRRVRIPEAPFALARASGAPLIVFFAFRTPAGSYRFTLLPPIHLQGATHRERSAVAQEAAQRYLNHLETALRRYPFQWYHFESFLERE